MLPRARRHRQRPLVYLLSHQRGGRGGKGLLQKGLGYSSSVRPYPVRKRAEGQTSVSRWRVREWCPKRPSDTSDGFFAIVGRKNFTADESLFIRVAVWRLCR